MTPTDTLERKYSPYVQTVRSGLPKSGEHVKVSLPGETPWARCIDVFETTWTGEIENKLYREYSEFERAKINKRDWHTVEPLPELHKYKQGDVLEFHWANNQWEPKP